MSGGAGAVGGVAPELRAEFPGLALAAQTVTARPGPSPPHVRQRLTLLADRATGARAVALRAQPLGHAYRAFFRQIGLDPDVTRVPSEAAVLRRLLAGGLASRGIVEDARTIAVLETGVPVWALDAARVEPAELLLRVARGHETLDGDALVAGELVVADGRAVLARLFEEIAVPFRPGPRTRTITLFAVGVDGIAPLVLDEALWLAAEVLGSA